MKTKTEPCECEARTQREESARKINDIFNRLRFDKETHLGEGTIKVSVEVQNEILEEVGK
jgi:hypothetical protein